MLLQLKIRASPRLEWWNTAIVDKWVREYCRSRIPPLKRFNQFENPFSTLMAYLMNHDFLQFDATPRPNIPTFHYSVRGEMWTWFKLYNGQQN
jgi:hypothetical protein